MAQDDLGGFDIILHFLGKAVQVNRFTIHDLVDEFDDIRALPLGDGQDFFIEAIQDTGNYF